MIRALLTLLASLFGWRPHKRMPRQKGAPQNAPTGNNRLRFVRRAARRNFTGARS